MATQWVPIRPELWYAVKFQPGQSLQAIEQERVAALAYMAAIMPVGQCAGKMCHLACPHSCISVAVFQQVQ